MERRSPLSPELASRIDAVSRVRSFNRFYTQHVGVLSRGLLDSPFSLTEVRVLYELAHQTGRPAAELGAELGLDAGYLSRILRRFEEQGLVAKKTSTTDARRVDLRLTAKGTKIFVALDARSREQVASALERLGPGEQRRLLDAMGTIRALLGPREPSKSPYLLRGPEAGDLGWIVHRHGALYAAEYGWDERFEALVAGIVKAFVEELDPGRERCWIAEKDGAVVGCVFVVKGSKHVAKLRLLLVEPSARGLGIGARLVAECIRFAKRARYRKLTLWTNDVLVSARKIYEAAGFRLVHEEPHESFGRRLVSQTWELSLAK